MKASEKLIREIDARFVSGNSVPVPDVRITREEWSVIRMLASAQVGWSHWEPTEQGRAYLAGSSR